MMSHFGEPTYLLITLFQFSILPPRKFIEASFLLQNSVKRLRSSNKMIPNTKNSLNHVGFKHFLKNGKSLNLHYLINLLLQNTELNDLYVKKAIVLEGIFLLSKFCS